MSSFRRRHERLIALAMVLGAVVLVPWILYLAGTLPHTTRARNWSLMWTGIDIAEALGLLRTGILLWRRSPYRALPAALTSTLLAADAWIDITTSAPGHARGLAIALALIEVPAAIGCLVLSIHAFPRVPGRPQGQRVVARRHARRERRIPVGRPGPHLTGGGLPSRPALASDVRTDSQRLS
jgi:hypothetical protein